MADLPNFTLRRAHEEEAAAIRDLVHQVGINPMGLDWRRFLVAVDPEGKLLGCGQLKPHGSKVLELASIAVDPGWRRRGIARAIIRDLLSDSPRPLYLMCRSGLQPFYEKFGFHSIEGDDLPGYFRRMKRLIGMYERVSYAEETIAIMKLQ